MASSPSSKQRQEHPWHFQPLCSSLPVYPILVHPIAPIVISPPWIFNLKSLDTFLHVLIVVLVE